MIDEALKFHSMPSQAVELLHADVPVSVGRLVGCTSVRDELAKRCEEPRDDEAEAGQVDPARGYVGRHTDPGAAVAQDSGDSCDPANLPASISGVLADPTALHNRLQTAQC